MKDCLEDNMNEDDFSDVGLGFLGWEGLGLGLWKGGLGSGGRWVGVKNCPEDNRNEDDFSDPAILPIRSFSCSRLSMFCHPPPPSSPPPSCRTAARSWPP